MKRERSTVRWFYSSGVEFWFTILEGKRRQDERKNRNVSISAVECVCVIRSPIVLSFHVWRVPLSVRPVVRPTCQSTEMKKKKFAVNDVQSRSYWL